ncbi:sensor histidine kinase [Corallococcus sp. H22C18031201]|uniref:sensor histidine kinase n=1 Tax=Citreicoccus inhibens TaxID=2849499 RepID=UPI000E72F7D2|nr:HAMP domain-containing sensor histidine kinase [Citreicoccus inhibens]MBU8896732.1 HAMP domain-containing histidine kinase [Citreicoccus inhibens]RJS21966.1 sensor histidine kinase [Corallococcus sp. H22C18031201]
MSLRAFFSVTLGALTVITLLAAASLVGLTTVLARTAGTLGDSLEGVRLAEELEVDLLSHARMSTTPTARDPSEGEEHDRSLQELEAEFPRQLAGLAATATTDAEKHLLEEVGVHIDTYLAAQRAPHLRSSTGDPRVEPSLDSALESLERLIQLNVNEAQAARDQAAQWDATANIAGLSLSALMLVSLVGVILWLRRFALRPVADISHAIRRFSSDRKNTRAPESGPTELREMARTFNEMANHLTHQQEQQLAFLAGVAHELRNPLSALKLSTAIADPGRAPLTPERMQRTLALVRRQVARLDRMVGDLLDATRIEAGRLELQPEVRDARELARAVVELYQSGDPGHVLRLSVPEEPVLVRADPSRLEQVLHNLVSNALKYSPSGSRVDVSVLSQGEEAILAVADQGIGIPVEERRQLFTPFQRAGNARQRAPGVGLGLSVARRIVEAHGGRIDVESEPGQGSTFRVHLALLSPTEARSPRTEAPPVPVH